MSPIDLDRDQWQQLKAVLTDALKLPSTERMDLLNRRLAEDPTLQERALEMLRVYDRATRPFGITETQSETRGGHAGTMPTADRAAGDIVGNYRIVRRLGAGGMGVVYLAEDQRLGRQVALKFLSPSVRGKLIDSKGQLLAEARSAAVLNHPGIVTFHDVFEAQGELVAVMEYVEGRSLSELIAGEPLPLGFALRLTGQLADALAYAHGRGIIHCDLKPANIHVLPNGATKILDFGIARAVSRPGDDPDSLDTPLVGTPGYLSPERLLGREATAASDVYALGVVMYQLLTGVPPFRIDDDAQLFLDTLTATPLPPSTLVPSAPNEVDDIVLRCLSKSARERLQPHELLRALNGVLRDLETSPVPVIGANGSTALDPVRKPDTAPITAGTVDSSVPRHNVSRSIAVVAGVAGALTLTGLITSYTYNGPLGLVGPYATESAIWWPVWGMRSLIAVTGGLVMLSLGTLTITGAARLVYATLPPLRRLCDPVLAAARRLTEPLRAIPTAMLAPGLLLVQLIVLGWFIWKFQPILVGLDSFLTRRSPEALWALRPQNRGQQDLLGALLTVNLFVLGGAWYWILKRAKGRNESDGRAAIWGGLATLIVSLLFFQVTPFRVLFHNQAERVAYRNDRCYLVGQRDGEALLFCPRRSPPLNQIVNIDDPALKREGTYESIFAAFDEQR